MIWEFLFLEVCLIKTNKVYVFIDLSVCVCFSVEKKWLFFSIRIALIQIFAIKQNNKIFILSCSMLYKDLREITEKYMKIIS